MVKVKGRAGLGIVIKAHATGGDGIVKVGKNGLAAVSIVARGNPIAIEAIAVAYGDAVIVAVGVGEAEG
ncbi:hypothetical protein [Thermus scotoductus]|uniref:hypothetical protein n=1 Tax=Thermus scotoductus TaxID=37636 RepID=UPI000F81195A|nr:hypothetical protein [Thermus scotoductus]